MIGDSIAMRALRKQISIVAPTDGRVLISGESGTGKELVARAIHAQSKRKKRAVCRDKFRRDSRRFGRIGTFRTRERRVFRRINGEKRKV